MALHGVGLCANKLWREVRKRFPVPIDMHGGSYVAAVVLTQFWVMLAWVFFRCDSAPQATELLAGFSVCGLTRARRCSRSRAGFSRLSGSITCLGALASGCCCRRDGLGRSRGAGSAPCSPSGSRRCRSYRNRSSTSSSEAVHPAASQMTLSRAWRCLTWTA
jgi:hypothetical protein